MFAERLLRHVLEFGINKVFHFVIYYCNLLYSLSIAAVKTLPYSLNYFRTYIVLFKKSYFVFTFFGDQWVIIVYRERLSSIYNNIRIANKQNLSKHIYVIYVIIQCSNNYSKFNFKNFKIQYL